MCCKTISRFIVVFILIAAAVRSVNLHKVPETGGIDEDKVVFSATARNFKGKLTINDSDATPPASLYTIQTVYEAWADPSGIQAAYAQQQKTAQRLVDQVLSALGIKPYIDRILAAWQEKSAVSVCSIMRSLIATLSQVLQYCCVRAMDAEPSAWSFHHDALVNWLDQSVCASPPDVTFAAGIFFFNLLLPALVMRPCWYMLGAVLYCLCAVAGVTTLGESVSIIAQNELIVAVAAAAHLTGAAGLVVVLVFFIGLSSRVVCGVIGTLQATLIVLLFGTPSFWVFVFSPVFFLGRLFTFNPFLAVPGLPFALFAGHKRLMALAQAFVIRAIQPFVRTAVFFYMIIRAAWSGELANVFTQFVWMWRFHAFMWIVLWWGPAWLLAVLLRALQIGWACQVSVLFAHCMDLFLLGDLTGGQLLYFAFLQVGLYSSFTMALVALGHKGLKVVLGWREQQRQKEEDKKKMMEELGYVPLNARDLANNPKMLQEQLQHRARAQAAMRKRR